MILPDPARVSLPLCPRTMLEAVVALMAVLSGTSRIALSAEHAAADTPQTTVPAAAVEPLDAWDDAANGGSQSRSSSDSSNADRESKRADDTTRNGTGKTPTLYDPAKSTNREQGAAKQEESAPSEGEAPLPAEEHNAKRLARARTNVEPLSLKGIHVGETTRSELDDTWGSPTQIKKVDGVVRRFYRIKPFDHVRVTLRGDKVVSMVGFFATPTPAQEVAKSLSLNDVDSVDVHNERGQLLGEAYPERGVLLGYAPGDARRLVTQVVGELIESQSFLLRAERDLSLDYANSLVDVDYAISLEPELARAHWVRARVLLLIGDLDASRKAAEKADVLDPKDPEYRLTLAKVLLETSDFQQAAQQTKLVIGTSHGETAAMARAYCQLADCLVAVPQPDFKQAMQHHLRAIALAEKLANDPRVAVRSAAKEVLLDAHLGVACDVGWGHWQQKQRVVPMWIDRAKLLAEEMVAHEDGNVEVRLRVQEQGLHALAGVLSPPNPDRMIEEMLRLGGELLGHVKDVGRRQRIEWQLGLALAHAVDIERARKQSDKALRYGEMAVQYVTQGNAAGEHLPVHDYLVGWLYFRLGSIYALERDDHVRALQRFKAAVPLLETPVPPSSLVIVGQQGEAFVSMAISYWHTEERDEAMRLTKQGLKLMEEAVEQGALRKSALAVPYTNLASMHNELGDEREARVFAERAAICRENSSEKK